jgi:hypothetical protein
MDRFVYFQILQVQMLPFTTQYASSMDISAGQWPETDMKYRKGLVFSRKSERNEMTGPESRFKPYREPLGSPWSGNSERKWRKIWIQRRFVGESTKSLEQHNVRVYRQIDFIYA